MANYILGIVAHKDRRVMRDRLESALYPTVTMEDDGSYGVTGNHLRVLRECFHQGSISGQEWVVVLEDDAVPVSPGFHRQLSAALDVAPSSVVSLYSGTGYPAQHQYKFKLAHQRQDLCWLLHPRLRHAVGYALQAECFGLGIIDQMAVCQQKGYAPDDAISAWCLRWSHQVAYTNPSLVDHFDGPSVIKTRKHLGMVTTMRRRPRVAHWAGTRMTWVDTVGQV